MSRFLSHRRLNLVFWAHADVEVFLSIAGIRAEMISRIGTDLRVASFNSIHLFHDMTYSRINRACLQMSQSKQCDTVCNLWTYPIYSHQFLDRFFITHTFQFFQNKLSRIDAFSIFLQSFSPETESTF